MVEPEATSTRSIESVTLIVPMYNEEKHIVGLVSDIAAQDYQGEIQMIVADGASTDQSVQRLTEAARRHDLDLRLIPNPERWVSAGLNRCIREATGDLIVRLDCHSRYPLDYLSRCVAASLETGADNVGGVFVSVGETPTERAVAAALDSPFGGVHWTRHGAGGRVETDTVPYGAFRPAAFQRAGLFDESLVRNQDDEFNLRLRLAGGRIVLDPSIEIYYTPRGSYRTLFRQYFGYGVWKPVVMRKHGRVVSGRSLVPSLFLCSLALLAVASAWLRPARILLASELVAYAVLLLAAAVAVLRRRHEPSRLLPRTLLAFATFHFAYVAGLLLGLLRRPRSVRGDG
jgi:glycosyltransferase involved in cell wall biosynthesis